MDERLKKALELSNLVETTQNLKRLSQEKFKERTVYYKNGVRFTINRELISFCKTISELNQQSFVLIDDDGDPVLIDNIIEFLKDITAIYIESSNSYIAEVTKINQQRSVSGAADIWVKVFYFLQITTLI